MSNLDKLMSDDRYEELLDIYSEMVEEYARTNKGKVKTANPQTLYHQTKVLKEMDEMLMKHAHEYKGDYGKREQRGKLSIFGGDEVSGSKGNIYGLIDKHKKYYEDYTKDQSQRMHDRLCESCEIIMGEIKELIDLVLDHSANSTDKNKIKRTIREMY